MTSSWVLARRREPTKICITQWVGSIPNDLETGYQPGEMSNQEGGKILFQVLKVPGEVIQELRILSEEFKIL